MYEDTQVADGADSTTADPAQQADPSAGTQNTGQPAEAQVPFHQHPRWQERTREIQTLRQQNQSLNTTLQQLQGRLQQLEAARSPSTPPSQEELAAREALHRLDPNLKNVGQYGEKLGELEGAVSEFRQERFVTTGERQIEVFAKQHGLDAATLSNTLTEIIKNDPALMERAQKGDARLVSQYLQGLQPVVASLRSQGQQAQREATVNAAQTKQQMLRTVPPRQAGSQSGAVAPPTLASDGSNAREHMAGLHKQADVLLERLKG